MTPAHVSQRPQTNTATVCTCYSWDGDSVPLRQRTPWARMCGLPERHCAPQGWLAMQWVRYFQVSCMLFQACNSACYLVGFTQTPTWLPRQGFEHRRWHSAAVSTSGVAPPGYDSANILDFDFPPLFARPLAIWIPRPVQQRVSEHFIELMKHA